MLDCELVLHLCPLLTLCVVLQGDDTLGEQECLVVGHCGFLADPLGRALEMGYLPEHEGLC